jgi:hypothetical protein
MCLMLWKRDWWPEMLRKKWWGEDTDPGLKWQGNWDNNIMRTFVIPSCDIFIIIKKKNGCGFENETRLENLTNNWSLVIKVTMLAFTGGLFCWLWSTFTFYSSYILKVKCLLNVQEIWRSTLWNVCKINCEIWADLFFRISQHIQWMLLFLMIPGPAYMRCGNPQLQLKN